MTEKGYGAGYEAGYENAIAEVRAKLKEEEGKSAKYLAEMGLMRHFLERVLFAGKDMAEQCRRTGRQNLHAKWVSLLKEIPSKRETGFAALDGVVSMMTEDKVDGSIVVVCGRMNPQAPAATERDVCAGVLLCVDPVVMLEETEKYLAEHPEERHG